MSTMRRRLTGRFGSVGISIAVVVAGLTAPFAAGSAQAAPGTPGVPQAPTAIFAEGFENGQGATPTLLTNYTGGPPVGETYTADPAWLTACNGWVTSPAASTTPPAGSGCVPGDWAQVKHLAGVLGQWSGGSSTTNHAVTAYTAGNPGAGKVQLETAAPIPLPAGRRFIAFSVDIAEVNCFANHSKFSFHLLDGDRATPAFTRPIEACVDATTTIGGAKVGTFTSNGAVLFAGSQAGIRLVNEQPSGTGNDVAFDNVKLVDASPQVDIGFAPTPVLTGGTSTLTFTITNTNELGAKPGWSFSDALPAGLEATGATTTTCDGGSVVAPAGAGSVDVAGNLTAGQESCTAQVQVTSAVRGTYTNCAAGFTNVVGVSLPGCASVVFDTMRFDAHAYGAALKSPLANIGPIAASDVTCSNVAAVDTDNVATVSLGVVGNAGVLTTRAEGTIDANGLQRANARAETAGVNLLGGLVTADVVEAVATVQGDANGGVTPSGSVTLANLRVAGVPVVNPNVNVDITIPLVATVRVNEQVVDPGGRGITVNALRITLLSGVSVVVSHARVALTLPGGTCPTA
ncbi:choice-of-anchor P family protein [Embleya sp. NPDC008237]|uniref:choice-of-anchor P family protein n=1 Tax=Embleya sp. NPDC008237 TaxID=3363978 RepID=UPI0036E87C23